LSNFPIVKGYGGFIMMKEFVDFLKNYGVIGMAIAVIIGGKLNEFVSSLVNDLVMPLVLKPALDAANVNNIKELSYNGILYGKVLGTALDFVIIAFVVFMFAKLVLREEKVAKK
jgi:large conductance mechanosensitive channel